MIKRITIAPTYRVSGVEKVNRMKMSSSKEREKQNKGNQQRKDNQKDFQEAMQREENKKDELKIYTKKRDFRT